jgi:hypothetical protein
MHALLCKCSSAYSHEINRLVHLCGDIDALSEASNSRCSSPEPSSLQSSSLDSSPTTAAPLPSLRAFQKQCHRKYHKNRRNTYSKLHKIERRHRLKILQAQCWHLSNARRCTNGYQGCPRIICGSIPKIPRDADAATHLNILKQHGYKVIEAPV